LNNPVLQEAVLDAARRTVPDLALKLSLPPSSSEERDGQRLGFADIWLDGRSERFHTLQRNHSQLHDMGVLLSRLKDSHGNYPPLLIIPHMPLKQALQCKEAHLNFLDTPKDPRNGWKLQSSGHQRRDAHPVQPAHLARTDQYALSGDQPQGSSLTGFSQSHSRKLGQPQIYRRTRKEPSPSDSENGADGFMGIQLSADAEKKAAGSSFLDNPF